MESLSLQEIIIKKIIFFRLNKELNYTETKDILKTSDTRKIHLTITINFIFLKDNEEECAMYSKSDNTETMINVEADEVTIELFKSPKNRHQKIIWNQLKVAILFSIMFIYCIINVINPNHGGSYEDSPGWIISKKATINPINKKDSKCFQYTITIV